MNNYAWLPNNKQHVESIKDVADLLIAMRRKWDTLPGFEEINRLVHEASEVVIKNDRERS